LSISPAFFSSRFGADNLFICLIALTIMTRTAKTEKPTVVFWYAFLAEKCILRPLFAHPKKSSLQAARYEAFTNDAKTGHLCDRGDFASSKASDRFPRNLLKINRLALKSAQTQGRQNRVTYNNMPCAKPEKRAFFCGHPVLIPTDVQEARSSIKVLRCFRWNRNQN
jgi:hypothetical protein